jgi:hypothetical protein
MNDGLPHRQFILNVAASRHLIADHLDGDVNSLLEQRSIFDGMHANANLVC